MPTAELGPDVAAQADILRETLLVLGQQFNLFSLLVAQSVGVPSLIAGAWISANDAPVVTIGSTPQFVLLGLLLLASGLLIAALWLGLVAWAVRSTANDPQIQSWSFGRWLRSGLIHGIRLILIGLIFFGASFALLPMLLVLGIVTQVNPGMGLAISSILFIALVWVTLWLTVHFYFVAEAVVLNNAGPLRALNESFQVVGRNFWSALLFIGLVFVISQGLGFIWLGLAETTVGLVLAVVGNAYVGTSLLAASFIFFADRYQIWQFQRTRQATRQVVGSDREQ